MTPSQSMVSKCMGRKSAVGFWEIMGYVSKMKEVPRRGEKERRLKCFIVLASNPV